jgi:hypothetical protein
MERFQEYVWIVGMSNYTRHGHKLRFFQKLERAICDRGHYNQAGKASDVE